MAMLCLQDNFLALYNATGGLLSLWMLSVGRSLPAYMTNYTSFKAGFQDLLEPPETIQVSPVSLSQARGPLLHASGSLEGRAFV